MIKNLALLNSELNLNQNFKAMLRDPSPGTQNLSTGSSMQQVQGASGEGSLTHFLI